MQEQERELLLVMHLCALNVVHYLFEIVKLYHLFVKVP